ncbi:retrovirus-related Pol polyprotein from transposon opus [Nephila pilipes]|uniref:Retrovirus-related Pol polyprotein from transposon opus n=1 Tax=Nephila pilipes TaxID=299642 RepID=A0A8X6INM2_NEPPI|nr:retrovirus-related Pol polyprotein from transposon opus [Nephila pilipes]
MHDPGFDAIRDDKHPIDSLQKSDIYEDMEKSEKTNRVDLGAQFRNAKLTADQTKYDYVISSIEPDTLSQVSDILLSLTPDGKYQTIKEILISSYANSETQNSNIFDWIRISDKESATQFLIDIGAELSVISPLSSVKRTVTKLEPFAANGTKIRTNGQKLLKLDLGFRRSLNWPFVIADVNRPIIGQKTYPKPEIILNEHNNHDEMHDPGFEAFRDDKHPIDSLQKSDIYEDMEKSQMTNRVDVTTIKRRERISMSNRYALVN